jgi:7-cyano-7-deazaguanine synthase
MGYDVETVSFNYGSKHNPYELGCAADLAFYYKVPHSLMDLQPVMFTFDSALLKDGGDIPEGHYSDESMKATVVPCRNLIFGSILAGIAESNNCNVIMLGVHAGDHAIYPDCRPEFVSAFSNTVAQATNGMVSVGAPFLYMSKIQIVTEGLQLGVPYHLTRTCYKDQPVACGKCGSCNERLEAFLENKIADPIEYEES